MDVDAPWWESASFEGRPISAFLAERDISALLRFLRARGFSRARLAGMTGLSETRVRQIAQGRQKVTSYDVLDRIAEGFGIPRRYLGLADKAQPAAVVTGAAWRDPPAATDPLIRESWDDLLDVLAVRSNALGCADLRRPAEGQVRLIASIRETASGPERRRLSATEARWTEFLSWIEANGRNPARADALLDRAHELAVEAGDQHLTSYILMRQSQQALENGDAVRAVGLARRARQVRAVPPLTTALCLVREAEAHALADDATACHESIDLALRLVSTVQDTADHLGGHCTVNYVRAYEARCRQVLGESAAATRVYEEILAGWRHDGRLDEGLWRADLALAYLDEGEPERAAAEGMSALQVAQATSSTRTLRAVGRLLPRLRRHRDLVAVPALTDAYRAALDACHD
ncbi:helix-turn-helix domain-containing protein [Micromonospora chalcea]|uniref:helix-turn-helix domain-containing protein n=1 Tax=Micromonospora chalcea TaxID=1874 RepID=UPI0038F7A4B7